MIMQVLAKIVSYINFFILLCDSFVSKVNHHPSINSMGLSMNVKTQINQFNSSFKTIQPFYVQRKSYVNVILRPTYLFTSLDKHERPLPDSSQLRQASQSESSSQGSGSLLARAQLALFLFTLLHCYFYLSKCQCSHGPLIANLLIT